MRTALSSQAARITLRQLGYLEAGLERLMRYTARGAVSLERLAQDANGDRIYRFNRPWSDRTTGITLAPLELQEKLVALVPLPRVHLVRYGGCLAPHSTRRAAIIPTPRQQRPPAEEGGGEGGAKKGLCIAYPSSPRVEQSC